MWKRVRQVFETIGALAVFAGGVGVIANSINIAEKIYVHMFQKTPEEIHQLADLLTRTIKEKETKEKRIADLETAINDLQKQPGLKVPKAVEAIRAGNTLEAMELFKRAGEAKASQAATTSREAAEDFRNEGALAVLSDVHRAEEAYQNAASLDPENLEGWKRLGELQKRVGHLDGAEKSFQKLMQPSEKPDQSKYAIVGCDGLGDIYKIQGKLDQAAATMEHCIALANQTGYTEGVPVVYGQLGIVYWLRGKLDKAEINLKHSLELNEKFGERGPIIADYSSLGIVYRFMGDLDRAEAYLKKSLDLFKQQSGSDADHVLIYVYRNLGSVYLARSVFKGTAGSLSLAEKAFEDGFKIAAKFMDEEGQAVGFGDLGKVYFYKGQLDRAEDQFNQSLSRGTRLESKEIEAIQNGNLGLVYFARGDLSKAADFYNRSLELFRGIDNKWGIAEQYSNLAAIHEKKNDLSQACNLWRQASGLYREVQMALERERTETAMQNAKCPAA